MTDLRPDSVAIRAGRADNGTALAPVLWAIVGVRDADARRGPPHVDRAARRAASTAATPTRR